MKNNLASRIEKTCSNKRTISKKVLDAFGREFDSILEQNENPIHIETFLEFLNMMNGHTELGNLMAEKLVQVMKDWAFYQGEAFILHLIVVLTHGVDLELIEKSYLGKQLIELLKEWILNPKLSLMMKNRTAEFLIKLLVNCKENKKRLLAAGIESLFKCLGSFPDWELQSFIVEIAFRICPKVETEKEKFIQVNLSGSFEHHPEKNELISVFSNMSGSYFLKGCRRFLNLFNQENIEEKKRPISLQCSEIKVVIQEKEHELKPLTSVADFFWIDFNQDYLTIFHEQNGEDEMSCFYFERDILEWKVEMSAMGVSLQLLIDKEWECFHKEKTLAKMNFIFSFSPKFEVSKVLETIFKESCQKRAKTSISKAPILLQNNEEVTAEKPEQQQEQEEEQPQEDLASQKTRVIFNIYFKPKIKTSCSIEAVYCPINYEKQLEEPKVKAESITERNSMISAHSFKSKIDQKSHVSAQPKAEPAEVEIVKENDYDYDFKIEDPPKPTKTFGKKRKATEAFENRIELQKQKMYDMKSSVHEDSVVVTETTYSEYAPSKTSTEPKKKNKPPLRKRPWNRPVAESKAEPIEQKEKITMPFVKERKVQPIETPVQVEEPKKSTQEQIKSFFQKTAESSFQETPGFMFQPPLPTPPVSATSHYTKPIKTFEFQFTPISNTKDYRQQQPLNDSFEWKNTINETNPFDYFLKSFNNETVKKQSKPAYQPTKPVYQQTPKQTPKPSRSIDSIAESYYNMGKTVESFFNHENEKLMQVETQRLSHLQNQFEQLLKEHVTQQYQLFQYFQETMQQLLQKENMAFHESVCQYENVLSESLKLFDSDLFQ